MRNLYEMTRDCHTLPGFYHKITTLKSSTLLLIGIISFLS